MGIITNLVNEIEKSSKFKNMSEPKLHGDGNGNGDGDGYGYRETATS